MHPTPPKSQAAFKLSELKNYKDDFFLNSNFVVDIDFTFKEGIEVLNCDFTFINGGSLHFESNEVNHCKIHGVIDPLEGYSIANVSLTFRKCSILNSKFYQNFDRFKIEQSQIRGINDTSNCREYSSDNSDFIDVVILGACEVLSYHKVVIGGVINSKSFWNKRISRSAHCAFVTFSEIQLQPFYLITYCGDKSSINMSQATLTDDWSKLRKKYTGVNLFIVFLLTFLFILPILVRSFKLLIIARIGLQNVSNEMVPLWDALLFGGKHGLSALIYAILTTILLTYNILRFWITLKISGLREEEKFLVDANFQMASIPPEKLKSALKVDNILKWIVWISIGYSILKLRDTLLIEVPIVWNENV